MAYNPANQPISLTYGENSSGMTETRAYNEDGLLYTADTDDDSDGDGMSDSWESARGHNPNSNSDASSDPDGDGLTNLQEFLAGTDPHDADSDGDSIADGLDPSATTNDTAWQVPVRSGVLR